MEPRGMASSLAEQGRFAEAVTAYEEYLVGHADDAVAHEELAQCLCELGNFESAYKAAQRAVNLAPQSWECWLTKARCSQNIGQLREAIVDYENCREFLPEHSSHKVVAQELATATRLWEHSIARRVGLNLAISQGASRGSLGPGQVVWESGICAAEYLAKYYPGRKQGRSVLELGCGTGIAGISAALLGFSPILLTDKPELQDLAQQNIQRNNLKATDITFAAVNWRTVEPRTVEGGFLGRQTWDLVLLADVLHSRSEVPHLLNVLRLLLESHSCFEIILAHPVRDKEMTDSFLGALRGLGCSIDLVAGSECDERMKVHLITAEYCDNSCCAHKFIEVL